MTTEEAIAELLGNLKARPGGLEDYGIRKVARIAAEEASERAADSREILTMFGTRCPCCASMEDE